MKPGVITHQAPTVKTPDQSDKRENTRRGGGGVLTDVAWGPTGCGHHVSFAFHFGQSKVTDHYFGLLILTVVQQVFGLGKKSRKGMDTLCRKLG